VLYAVIPLAVLALLALQASAGLRGTTAVGDATVAAGLWLMMAGWVRSNRARLQQAEWCDCARESVGIRVITSAPPAGAGGASVGPGRHRHRHRRAIAKHDPRAGDTSRQTSDR
jgi:hypothetical protein